MNKSRRTHQIFALFCLCLLCATIGGLIPAALSAANPDSASGMPAPTESASVVESSYLPGGVAELIKFSQAKYVEGSNLIKSGESEKAQEAFNQAVDLLLQSNWDLASTPALNRYFQELIQRIQQDESRYLLAPYILDEDAEDEIANKLADLELLPVPVDSDLREELALDLANAKYEIPITINERVLKSLNFWLNRGRKVFEGGLIRSGQYRPMIEKIFREESVPLDLIYLAQVESMFRPHATSKAKAKGIWQFGKGTAIRYGLKVTRDVDERSDPEKSTRAAARYLNDLFAMFKDWNLALAAYNWGEGKIQRLMNSTGLKDFWQLVDLKRKLPEETKKHVPLIQASVILGRNPEKYGLPTEWDPPLEYSEVSVSRPIDLRAAAKILSTSIEELKKLNPSLKGFTTPANYPNFRLKVPAESSPETHEQLAALPAAKITAISKSTCRHKVRSGETLTRIAARYGVTLAELRQANDFSKEDILKTGAWIRLPHCSESAAKSSNKTEAKAKSSRSSGANAISAKVKANTSNSKITSLRNKPQQPTALEKTATKQSDS